MNASTNQNASATASASIIDKIRKLRALSQSENVHEAAAAAAAAERLIQEHSLEEAELEAGGGSSGSGEGITHDVAAETEGSRCQGWHGQLLVKLCNAYQCSGFYERGAYGAREVTRFVAYGRPGDLATLKYQFAWYAAEITRLCASVSKGKGRTWANSFRMGAVYAIGEALTAANKGVRAHATGAALAVIDERAELAREQRDQDHPSLRSTAPRSSMNRDAFVAGQRAGTHISQRGQASQLGVGGNKLLGSGSRGGS